MANVTVTLSVTLDQNALADLITHWTDQHSGILATLANPVAPTDTTITLEAPVPSIVIGSTLRIDSEAIPVTGVSGPVLTVTRGTLPGQVAAAHDVGEPVATLNYPDPGAMVNAEAISPWALQVIKGLIASGRSALLAPAIITATLA